MFEASQVQQDGLRVQLVVQPAVNQALVLNGVPLVRQVTVTNVGDLTIDGLDLELTLVGPTGPLAAAWRVSLESPLAPDRTVSWDEFPPLAPDAAAVVSANEAYPAEFRLVVTRPDGPVAPGEPVAPVPPVRLTAPTLILAHNEWWNHPALYDALAAFVQPNTRAVDALLKSAAGILLRHTGSDSIDGYQSGPARAAAIAGAVYEALRRQRLTYQSGAASFESGAQKIRTTAAVLESGLANCLDLSVTYASCLEAAGLHPLIWLTENHAFAGFFLDDERLATPTVTETNLLVTLVESGRAVPVELTAIGEGGLDFTGAVQSGLSRLRDTPGLRAAVDVALAHRCGIRPLPSPEAGGPAAEPTVDAAPQDGSIALPPGAAQERLSRQDAGAEEVVDHFDPAPPRVRQWKRSLLDLSLRNPLLNLPTRGKGVDLHVPANTLAALDDLVHQGKRIALVPEDTLSGVAKAAGARGVADLDQAALQRELVEDKRIYAAVTAERYRTVMRALQRDARTMIQETGSNYLYLTLGTLVHRKEGGGEAHAPLFLLPVRLEGGAGRAPYHIVIDGTEVATPNQCLVEWLRVKHRVRLPALENPTLDEAGIDISATLTALRDGLVAHELDYRIDERASLRLLQFSSFQMWRDLSDHWQSFMDNPVVAHLVNRVEARFTDPAGDDEPEVDESTLHLPIPADGSQMRAVVMAEQGRSFVLEGPPGTGKSQTITNMIARAIHSGRSVLFVAEKQAALEVVRRKLDQIGLGPFTLDLHGRKQSLNQIREQLREAFDQTDAGDDGAWRAATTRLRTQLAPLARYPERVHTPNGAGLSLWSSYADTLRYGPGAVAPVPVAHLTTPAAQAEALNRALEDLPGVAHAARLRADHPWSLAEPRNPDGTRGIAGLDPATVLAAATRLEEARAALVARPHLSTVVSGLFGPAALGRLAAVAQLALAGALPDHASLTRASDPGWDRSIAYVQGALHNFRQAYAWDLATFRPEVLAAPQLDEWASTAREAAERFLAPIFGRRDLQRIGEALRPYLRQGELDDKQLPAVLTRLLAARREAVDLAHQVARHGGLALAPGWRPEADGAFEEFSRAVHATRLARALLREAPAAVAHLRAGADPGDLAVLAAADSAWRDWSTLLGITEESLALWAGGSIAGKWFERWQRDGAQWRQELHDEGLVGLHRWSQLLSTLDVQIAAGLAEFRMGLLRGEVSADAAEEAYRRGLAVRSVAERMAAGDLNFFEPSVHNGIIDQYEAAAATMRATLPRQLPAELVRRRGFDTAAPRGTSEGGSPVVELVEQVKRKRGGKSFRELFAAYSDQILRLTPCVLVSPASAATFLDPKAAKFDIVIFDEASQIRVAEAIGAMGRGRSVVIVGDSKQMPPSAVMRASHEDDSGETDDEQQAAQDMESILSEAVESQVPRHPLTWHYRSRDESLIAFSNHRYYGRRLFSLPSPGAGADTGLVWRRVNGTFDRGRTRTNEVEARAVVEEIARRLHDPATANASLGVVTFNIQQRDLILNLLEDSDDPLVTARLTEESEEPIFVKNLENVQGDERDVILFSLAFSTDPATGLLPLNFGPLSQVGGERRLNVAITRARRLVMLFASFDPADIDLSRTSAVGTRDLRAYCELAANGPAALSGGSLSRAARTDEVRAAVADAIRDRGHDVVVGYGLSDFTVDIAVRRPGASRWQVAIILDGPQWAARPTVADRDSAPRLLRESMQWPALLRFYLPAWIRDRESFLREVDEAIANAEAAEAQATAEAAAAGAEPGAEVQPTAAATEPGDQTAPATPAGPGAESATPATPSQVKGARGSRERGTRRSPRK